MREFTSFLEPQLKSYIAYRQASGVWCYCYELQLYYFDRYCHNQYPTATELSQEMVDTWCAKHESESNNTCRTRGYAILTFVRYLRKRGLTNVAEPVLPKPMPSTHIPHAFTETELQRFFEVCDSIQPAYRSKRCLCAKMTLPVLFRLMYSSGLRPNEARMLKRECVNLDDGVINVLYSKGRDQHYVVLHDSMLPIMRKYDVSTQTLYPNRTFFFPAENDGFHTAQWMSDNLRKLWLVQNKSYIVPYDFRHNYAVENINSWTSEGFGFNDKLVSLSKSMGHSSLESTKYYYSLVPALADILEAQTGEEAVIPEVAYEIY